MLRGRYGIGWMVVAWAALAVCVALAIFGALNLAQFISR
jgi:hypothetical protein